MALVLILFAVALVLSVVAFGLAIGMDVSYTASAYTPITEKHATSPGALNPCPWCGKTPEREAYRDYDDSGVVRAYFVQCDNDNCDVQPKSCSTDSQADADGMWNSRAVSE